MTIQAHYRASVYKIQASVTFEPCDRREQLQRLRDDRFQVRQFLCLFIVDSISASKDLYDSFEFYRRCRILSVLSISKSATNQHPQWSSSVVTNNWSISFDPVRHDQPRTLQIVQVKPLTTGKHYNEVQNTQAKFLISLIYFIISKEWWSTGNHLSGSHSGIFRSFLHQHSFTSLQSHGDVTVILTSMDSKTVQFDLFNSESLTKTLNRIGLPPMSVSGRGRPRKTEELRTSPHILAILFQSINRADQLARQINSERVTSLSRNCRLQCSNFNFISTNNYLCISSSRIQDFVL